MVSGFFNRENDSGSVQSRRGDFWMRHAALFVLFLWTLASTSTPWAEIILVGPGEDYETIQSAIDATTAGGVVQVLPWEYPENIVLKEGVDVVGSGADKTIIRSRSESFPMATVVGSDDVTLSDFTITGGYYGVRCDGASPTITECVIQQNASCGIFLEASSPTITRSVIAQNPRYGVRCLGSSAPAISNCTFSANGYAVSSSSSAPSLTNCILWDNWDDLHGIADGNSIRHCDIKDGDFAGENGNISVDPRFVAWGSFNDSDNPLFADVLHVGPEEGTRENPFTKIALALSVHSYALGLGSPCLNAGEGSVHMGAYPDEQPSQAPGSDGVVVNVAPGTYYEGRLFACHGAQVRGSRDSPAIIVGAGNTVFFALGRSSVENFIILGGDDAIGCFFSEATVSNCVILECGQNGVYSFKGNPSIRRCHMFYNPNVGVLLDGGSGAISDCFISEHGSAGVSCTGGASVTVTNCLLTENPVGLSCAGGANVELRNATVSNAGWKGVEAKEGATVTIVNSIVWGNPFGELSEEGGSIEATFSDIGGGFPGDGNINENPLFEDGPLGGFYLDSDSPCVDSGSDTAENLALDTKTTLCTSEPDSGTVDMGFHYETFEIRKVTLNDGLVTLQWNSTPRLDYAVFRAPALAVSVAWEAKGEMTASWTQASYSLDEASAAAGFYRVSRP